MSLAVHLLIDFHGVAPALADDVALLERALLAAAEAARCGVLGVVRKKFEPQGASVVVLVSESHLSAHSWPEHGYVAFDVFTCGDTLQAAAVEVLRAHLHPASVEVRTMHRGTPPDPSKR